MAGEHSIIVRTVKYALPVTRPALLIVCSGRSLPHLLKQNRPFTQASSPTSLKIVDSWWIFSDWLMHVDDQPYSSSLALHQYHLMGQNVAEIIKYPCHLFLYKTLTERYAIALSWKQDMVSLGLYIYILVLTHFRTGHRKPKTRSQF